MQQRVAKRLPKLNLQTLLSFPFPRKLQTSTYSAPPSARRSAPALRFDIMGTTIDPALATDTISGNNADDDISKQIGPPPTHAPQQGPVMATLQPSHPDQYRALPSLPPPQQMYAPQYPQAQQMGYPPTQPAPRQRTAIACRYCRRRKVRTVKQNMYSHIRTTNQHQIRCSGFDQSEDGRCTNCQRFSQECVFTPVSAQTQAFVPAHTVYRGQNMPPNTQLYGAYGQPLPPGGRDAYPPQQQQPGQYGPPPQGYQQQQPMYAQQPQQGGQVAPLQTPNPGDAGRKRANDEPHTPTLPPPNPASQMPHRGSGDGQYAYPDHSAGASAFLPASYPSAYPSTQYQPHHGSRASSSPHPSNLQPGPPVREGGRSPPAIKQEERTSHDSTMLQSFSRGPK